MKSAPGEPAVDTARGRRNETSSLRYPHFTNGALDGGERRPALAAGPENQPEGRRPQDRGGGAHAVERRREGERPEPEDEPYPDHRDARPPARSHELVAGAVIFDGDDQTRRAKCAAHHFQVPAIPVATPAHHGADGPQVLLDAPQPLVRLLPALGPAREGPCPGKGRPHSRRPHTRSSFQAPMQARDGMEHVEERREEA